MKSRATDARGHFWTAMDALEQLQEEGCPFDAPAKDLEHAQQLVEDALHSLEEARVLLNLPTTDGDMAEMRYFVPRDGT